MEDFTRELTPGNTKAAMKAVGAASSDLWKVAPDQLRTLDGFNARIKNDAYAARVRWIADSIKANGFYPDKPLTGFVALEDGEEVIYVTGGHRRHEGVLLAIEEGADDSFTEKCVDLVRQIAARSTLDTYTSRDFVQLIEAAYAITNPEAAK